MIRGKIENPAAENFSIYTKFKKRKEKSDGGGKKSDGHCEYLQYYRGTF
jgi:hypothetical protein